MKSCAIALKDVLVRLRDRTAFITLLIVPMVMIIILGTVFNWTSTAFKATLAVADLDHGTVASYLTHDVFQGNDLSNLLLITTVQSEAQARTLVEQNKVGAAVIIPPGFSQDATTGKHVSITVLGNPEQSNQAGVVRSIVTAFTDEVERRRLAAETAIGALQRSKLLSPVQLSEATKAVLKETAVSSAETSSVNVHASIEEGKKTPSALGYYAVGMALLYLLFTASAGTDDMLEEKRQHTLQRALTTPTSYVQILLGKMTGIVLVSLLQFTAVIVLTRVLYRVSWGASPGALLLMTVSTVLAGAGLATLVAALARNPEQAGALGPAVALIYSLVGGSMWPVYDMPNWWNRVSRLTFTRWSLEGFTALMTGGGIASVIKPVVVCCSMAGVFLLVAAVFLSRTYRA